MDSRLLNAKKRHKKKQSRLLAISLLLFDLMELMMEKDEISSASSHNINDSCQDGIDNDKPAMQARKPSTVHWATDNATLHHPIATPKLGLTSPSPSILRSSVKPAKLEFGHSASTTFQNDNIWLMQQSGYLEENKNHNEPVCKCANSESTTANQNVNQIAMKITTV